MGNHRPLQPASTQPETPQQDAPSPFSGVIQFHFLEAKTPAPGQLVAVQRSRTCREIR
jgi:hypothetical protein